MEEAEVNGDRVHFCTDSQCISLHLQGMGSETVAPAAPKRRRWVEVTLAFVMGTMVSCFVALLVVALWPRADPSFQKFHAMADNVTSWPSLVEPDNSFHFGRVAEEQEVIQMFKDHVENSKSWPVEIQWLKYRMDNVSSQIQMLSGHQTNTSADLQRVNGVLEDIGIWSTQTQMLRSSLEEANAEIQDLKGALEKANTLNSQNHNFLQSSSENTGVELHMLSRGLENASAEIQMLKAGLEVANAQVWLANSSLQNARVEIHLLKGSLGSLDILRTQNQALSNSLEEANAEIQRLKGGLQNANTFTSQTRAFINDSLDHTSAEIWSLRGHLERAGDEIQLLRDLETAQTQRANHSMEETKAQIQVLKAELENASALSSSQIQVLNSHLQNVGRDIETLKQGMKDAALNSQIQTLESSLQKASAEIQKLKHDLENIETLSAKVPEQQSSVEALRTAFASWEQLQKTQNQLLQLILQGWKVFSGSLYYFSDAKKSWNEAEQFCVSQGAHLASVTSEEEQTFLTKSTSTSHHWIGLTDTGTEGFWHWVDGTPFSSARSRRFWGRNQPDNWRHENGHTEDCVHIQQMWNDMYCDAAYQWVCKKPVGQDVA
ncbi:C-type lectin domain family 4 member F isoform X1 [Choloepus didactylus]|uniref:C-type lectin domain family 4 member F isoform X1 n=1 Tax=Choloepus didactylus TaxID=27675 RepID=UPI00189CA341|nr:C-type lectin domain family 4 member F isoform X1 [Choloepus didactylus]